MSDTLAFVLASYPSVIANASVAIHNLHKENFATSSLRGKAEAIYNAESRLSLYNFKLLRIPL